MNEPSLEYLRQAAVAAAAELVDVVNEAGEVVGVATRAEIRARRLPHRCTYLLVFNLSGQIFIHRRTATKDVFPSFWDVACGGVLGSGEEWEFGARREAAEELGIESDPSFLFDLHYDGLGGVAFGKVYRVVHDGPFRLQPEEIVEGRFVSKNEVETMIARERFCPDGLQAWEEYLRRFG